MVCNPKPSLVVPEYCLLLAAGIALAWFGGELFVKSAVSLAQWARWPHAVIGVTVAAFGTSLPELLVAVRAAAEGIPQISLGDVLGSNVINVALVLGIVLALTGMRVKGGGTQRDWLVALAAPGIIFTVLSDGRFSRLDAAIVLGCFVVWLLAVLREARSHAAKQPKVAARGSLGKPLFFAAIGLGLLIVAALCVVRGGKGVALALGWSPFIVGVIVVAAATSTPELATTLIARVRGHHDVGLGNILGSNIFNTFFIASVAALIRPYTVKLPELWPSLAFCAVTLLIVVPGREGHLRRWRGAVLLAMYVAFVLLTLKQTASP